MSRSRLLAATCSGFMLLGALLTMPTVATAGWRVSKADLVGSASVAPNPTVDKEFRLKAAGVTIVCTQLKLNSGSITAPNTISVAAFEFGQCMSENPNCSVTKSIDTVPSVGVATLEGSGAGKIVFAPKTKNIFTTIEYKGVTCPLLGIQPVSGKASFRGPSLQNESVKQLLQAATVESSGELKVGSSPAELTGEMLVELSGSPSPTWSFV